MTAFADGAAGAAASSDEAEGAAALAGAAVGMAFDSATFAGAPVGSTTFAGTIAATGFPQFTQNLAPRGSFAPHFVQYMPVVLHLDSLLFARYCKP